MAGNPGKRELNQTEPQPQGDLFAAPDWFNASQKAGWDYAIEHAPAGLLKMLDRSILKVWVIAEDMHQQAVEKVNQHGILIKTPDGYPVQSPFMAVMNRQGLLMMKAAAELGFTPSSRTQIQVAPKEANVFSNNGRRPT